MEGLDPADPINYTYDPKVAAAGGMVKYAAGRDRIGFMSGGKAAWWKDGGHRVPFIARWPGHIAPGTTSDDLVCLVDLSATAAAVAGEKLPDGAAPDSFNLLPTLLGQPKQLKRDTLVVMSGNGDLALRQDPWKYLPDLAVADGCRKPPPWQMPQQNEQLSQTKSSCEFTT